jgi:hypothetical protein
MSYGAVLALASALTAGACGRSAPQPSELFTDQSRIHLTTAELDELASRLVTHTATALAANLAEADRQAPACGSPDFDAHVRALTVAGRIDECLEVTGACSGPKAPRSADVLLAKARCAAARYDYDGADAAFAAAVHASKAPSTGLVLTYAHFALSTQYADRVDAILDLAPRLDQAQRRAWRGALDYLVTKSETTVTVDEIEALVSAALAGSGAAADDEALRDFAASAWLTSLVGQQYRYHDGLAFVREHLDDWGLPLAPGAEPNRWLSAVYGGFYGMPDDGLRWARSIYDEYAPYASEFDLLPTETNSLTYTEIYASACTDGVLPPDGLAALRRTSNAWKTGAITTDAAEAAAHELAARYGERRADLLTFVGALAESRGDDATALSSFMAAHRACRYYDRAHWGLVSVRRRAAWEGFAEYPAQLAGIDRALGDVRYPSTLASYVDNYASLNAGEQKRLQYALRFWAPHIDRLLGAGQHIYIKRDFELLSEAPDLGDIRDVRIDYPYDERLWDDVRGLGGNPVVADMGETAGAAFGAYNLVAHEVAHQFHQQAPLAVSDCILRLFAAATERGDFADPYASTNEYEYFAQGVTYYNIPEDAPARFGVNRGWLPAHDPDLLAFVQSVETATGSLDALACPIAPLATPAAASAAPAPAQPRILHEPADLQILSGAI